MTAEFSWTALAYSAMNRGTREACDGAQTDAQTMQEEEVSKGNDMQPGTGSMRKCQRERWASRCFFLRAWLLLNPDNGLVPTSPYRRVVGRLRISQARFRVE
ncbi:hypothetical protein SRHO_G00086130 [Serrasalmus rhombeus]